MMSTIKKTISKLLKEGASANKIALAVALGLTIGLFPLYGTNSILCALAAFLFRVNPVLIQLVNYAAILIFFPVCTAFVWAGQWLTGQNTHPVTLTTLVDLYNTQGLGHTLHSIWQVMWSATAVWALIAVPMTLLLHRLFLMWIQAFLFKTPRACLL